MEEAKKVAKAEGVAVNRVIVFSLQEDDSQTRKPLSSAGPHINHDTSVQPKERR